MVFIEQGKEQGLDWCLQVVQAVDLRFYPHLQVGTAIKVSAKTYKEEWQAVDAGRAMLADTLAQREDEDER